MGEGEGAGGGGWSGVCSGFGLGAGLWVGRRRVEAGALGAGMEVAAGAGSEVGGWEVGGWASAPGFEAAW